MRMHKICVVTGTRAEYGMLYWLLSEIKDDPDLELQIIVTGMHLSPEYGLTYKLIEEDGYYIDAKVEMLLSSDTSVGIAKSLGLGVIGFADALDRLRPDVLIVLGDRYEILAAVQAALVSKIPVAHIAGGDTTEGAFDESIRHSITKMAHLHFVTNERSALRVRQLGENPDHIFNVGSPGIEQINKLIYLNRDEIQRVLKFTLREKNILVTFHPVTLDETSSEIQFRELLDALDCLEGNIGLIFTKPNSDNGSRILMQMIDSYVSTRVNAVAHSNLGNLVYLSALAHVDVVVGNSSSGLYEAPSFKKPTVNIGSRQRGRVQADSVINCESNQDKIVFAINEAFNKDCSNTTNPYGQGNSSKLIVNEIKNIRDCQKLLIKQFYDVKKDK